ncbi:uncharacterized protein isoform X2 [Leptinotarsa decemlineata]|uniref:uncharacterized protein isoform X2 n=1 Tax=Leptinotarsa decemlineata TaxID=7539 RepID=UPI003D304404
MASKRVRVSRNIKLSRAKDYNELNLSDVLCPICRSIIIEPVSLPCSHDFCLSCFEGTMENANLVCPLCRLRIASWMRRVKKESKLVNEEFWEAIQKNFPEQIERKRIGVDDNLEEKPEIRVSHPGEIRKEYELQKQKEDEEFRKLQEAELKASEELIKKLKDEEDYQQAVIEEKLKMDEQVAKKLASEMSLSTSFSKSKIFCKKSGPMDKFIKKDNETITSENEGPDRKSTYNNYDTKEYTCRVLRLDTVDKNKDRTQIFSPIIKKKIQQIQKIVDAGTASDSSDCIESEMRYFKPIDHRLNPPSQGKAPIKVFPKKLVRNAEIKIMSPSGLKNFCSNDLESAFVRLSLSLPVSPLPTPTSPEDRNNGERTGGLKRLRSEDDIVTSEEKKTKCDESGIENEKKKSPIINYNICSIAKRHLFGRKTVNNVKNEDSPPFYGFERDCEVKKLEVTNNIRKNGTVHEMEDSATRKLLQEKADLEFAKKLQEELNRGVHNTRSSRNVGRSKRQTTLDEMIKSPYRVK